MKVQNKSKRNEPNFGLNHIRSGDCLKILRLLREGLPQSEIAKRLSLPKTNINYWTRKFLKKNLIRVKIHGKPIFYELTAFGSKVLTGSEMCWSPPIIMEDFGMKFRLVRDHGVLVWEKLGEPKNWIKQGIKVDNCRVEKTSQSIIIHTGQLQGFNPNQLLVEAGGIIQSVKDFLESRGVEMESEGLPVHQPIFKFYTPESEILNRAGTISTSNGAIDHSPPDGIPHVEWNLETSINYLEMPNRVKDNQRTLEAILDSMQIFAKSMDEHIRLITALQEVCRELKTTINELKNGGSNPSLITTSIFLGASKHVHKDLVGIRYNAFWRLAQWLNREICIIISADSRSS